VAQTKLGSVIHVQPGIQGQPANIGIIVNRSDCHPILAEHVRTERVQTLFAGVSNGLLLPDDLSAFTPAIVLPSGDRAVAVQFLCILTRTGRHLPEAWPG